MIFAMDLTDSQHLQAATRTSAEGVPRTDASWLEAHWMPYTGNRQFKADPRLITSAKGAYLTTSDGRQLFDGLSGLWCTGLGHCRDEISQAVARQVATLDYSPAFQFGHPLSFELANRVIERMPSGLTHVFFTGSGSESADTSLKMARAYWRAKGQASKTRLIGRIKGYHGVNFGGISVGGIVANRKLYGQGVEADHLPHTQPPNGSFFRGMPPAAPTGSYPGAALADELLNLISLHDASNIAAVIVEPFSGSAGVVIPPQGYLQRLREICTQHNILLIFDEVISGFGRSGAWTGAEAFGVTPDILNFAKQVTNGVQPLGGVVATREIYDTFMAAGGPDYMLSSRTVTPTRPTRWPVRQASPPCSLWNESTPWSGCVNSRPTSNGRYTACRAPGTWPISATSVWPPVSPSPRCQASPPDGLSRLPWPCTARAFTCAMGATPSSWLPPSSARRLRSTGWSARWATRSRKRPDQPRPTKGIFVAITVVNSTLADKGSRAMAMKVCTTASMSIRASGRTLPSA